MIHVYGIEHILYLLFSICLVVGVTLFAKRKIKTEKGLQLLIRLCGLVLFAMILYNRLSICVNSQYWYAPENGVFGRFQLILPNSFCGVTSLCLSLAVMFGRRDNIALHALTYLGLLGGLLTLAYPDFIGQDPSFFYSCTISGLLHHTMAVVLSVLMLSTGYVRPDFKKWYALPICFCIYITYGLFLVRVLSYGDAFYIYTEILDGTSLNWWTMAVILFPVHLLWLFIYTKLTTHKGVRRNVRKSHSA